MAVFKNFFGGGFFEGGFFGGGTVTGGGGYHPSQGYTGYETRIKTKEEVRLERERLGIIPKRVEVIIEKVAERQALTEEQDRQKQYDEFVGELRLEKLKVESYYIEALNLERERLIGERLQSQEVERLKVEEQSRRDFSILMLLAKEFAEEQRDLLLNAFRDSSLQVDEAIQKASGIINIFQQAVDASGEKVSVKTSKDQAVQEKFLSELEQIMSDLKKMT